MHPLIREAFPSWADFLTCIGLSLFLVGMACLAGLAS